MDTRKNILEIKNMHTYFFTDNGVVKSVDGVDIELKEGSTLGIVGESGSGKSVTALSVMGLLMGTTGKVVEGQILLDGRDITNLSAEERRKIRGNQISMIFQEPMTSLNPVMKIGDQLVEAIKMHQNKTKEEAQSMAVEMLKKTGLPRVERIVNEYPFQLSGGQRQRVMIAMALVCNPKILIADEPTTALDVTIQAQIIDLMNHLKKEIGTSIMFITHDLGVVAETCDEVVVMYCGRVVERGDVKTIFANPSHPYTKGLFDSLPNLQDDSPRLKPIPGLMSNPMDLPSYCSFYDRCSVKCDSCKNSNPKLIEITPGHTVACSRIAQAQKEAK